MQEEIRWQVNPKKASRPFAKTTPWIHPDPHGLRDHRRCEPPYSLNVVQFAIREIDHSHDALSIRALSDQIGISQNYLAARFKQFVGIAPKEVARFFRFAHILRLIDVARPIDLTCITHESQYYDQSHFNKDFVAFTGYSLVNMCNYAAGWRLKIPNMPVL